MEWVPDAELEPIDPRVVRRKADGLVRLTFLSHLRVVRCGDGRSVESVTEVCFTPQSEWEEFGVEDARITPLDGRFWFTYVAVSRHGAATALASTTDFRTFDRHGIIFCPENKDVVLFPQRVGGAYAALHRPNGATPFTRPEMWLARSPDLTHWGRNEPLYGGSGAWETGRIGAGPPPIRTADGWLALYHGNRHPTRPGEVGAYAAGALLLDLENPARVLCRTAGGHHGAHGRLRAARLRPGCHFPDRDRGDRRNAARLLWRRGRLHRRGRVLARRVARCDESLTKHLARDGAYILSWPPLRGPGAVVEENRLHCAGVHTRPPRDRGARWMDCLALAHTESLTPTPHPGVPERGDGGRTRARGLARDGLSGRLAGE